MFECLCYSYVYVFKIIYTWFWYFVDTILLTLFFLENYVQCKETICYFSLKCVCVCVCVYGRGGCDKMEWGDLSFNQINWGSSLMEMGRKKISENRTLSPSYNSELESIWTWILIMEKQDSNQKCEGWKDGEVLQHFYHHKFNFSLFQLSTKFVIWFESSKGFTQF